MNMSWKNLLNLWDILKHQNIDGSFEHKYFSDLSEFSYVVSSIPASITDLAETDDVKQTIWATIIALYILENKFKD